MPGQRIHRITVQEMRKITLNAYLSVIAADPEPAVGEFFATKIDETIPPNQPSHWPNFWETAIAARIQLDFGQRGRFIEYFSERWILDNREEAWEKLIDHMREGNLVPVPA